MNIYAINTGHFKLDGGAMYGVVPKSIWQKLNPSDENNMCPWALRSILIVHNDKKILVDTGMGNKQDDKFFSYYFMHGADSLDNSLATYGFTKDDITDVVHTHLHFDHCGGTIENKDELLTPACVNAQMWVHKAHWDWAIHPNAREKASFLKENLLPMQESGKLQFVQSTPDNDTFERSMQLPSKLESLEEIPSGIIDELSYIVVNGHTRAMLLPKITYGDKTYIFTGDLIPSVGHLPIPYVMAYDMFPYVTLLEKKTFLEKAVSENAHLIFQHDPTQECCTLHKTERGIRANKIGNLKDF